jgi:hypothetical protein
LKNILSGQSNFGDTVRVIKCVVITAKKITKEDFWRATGFDQ